MPSFRASAALLCGTALIAAAALPGCASGGFSAEPPPGVRLAGDWKLDRARSDDLGQAVGRLQEQARKAQRQGRDEHREDASTGAEGPASGHRRAGSDQPDGKGAGQADESAGASEPGVSGIGAGPPRASSVDELMSSVPRGEYLSIRVSADSFTVTSGDSSDQYTPGLESEISAEKGDARQISGWKGGDYVIDTKPQWGAEIIQTYGLTKDGRLAMTLRLTGGRTDFTFTRVYDRTKSVAPLAPPTID